MQVTIDRFEGDRAILRMGDDQTFHVQRSELPPTAREGDILTAVFRTDADATTDHVTRARAILNELLGNPNEERKQERTENPGTKNS